MTRQEANERYEIALRSGPEVVPLLLKAILDQLIDMHEENPWRKEDQS